MLPVCACAVSYCVQRLSSCTEYVTSACFDVCFLSRASNQEEMWRSTEAVVQSRHLQDEMENLHDRLHSVQVSAWQSLLVAGLPS